MNIRPIHVAVFDTTRQLSPTVVTRLQQLSPAVVLDGVGHTLPTLQANASRPDIILCDITPQLSTTIKNLKSLFPNATMIALVNRETDLAIAKALQCGAFGYLTYDETNLQIYSQTINHVASNRSLLEKNVAIEVRNLLLQAQKQLSPPAQIVLDEAANGHSCQAIAQILGNNVTEEIVARHFYNIIARLH